MSDELLAALNGFLGRASKSTYAGGGGETDSWRKGFKELEYSEDGWYYRDSYTGYLRSWGQEVVWHNDKPAWTCLYGGGMTEDHMDSVFADKTFVFLKQVLSAGDKEIIFQPRGPKKFSDGDWKYQCTFDGDISKFSGNESISYKNEVIFTHEFFGGLVIASTSV